LIVDSIPVNSFLKSNYNPVTFKVYKDSENQEYYFVYYNDKDSSVDFVNTNDSTVIKKVYLHYSIENTDDFAVLSADSIMVLNGKSPKTIFLFTKNRRLAFKIKESIPVYNDKYLISCFCYYPFSILKDELLVYSFPEEVLDNKSKLEKYYNTPRDLHLKFVNNELKIVKLTGRYCK